MAYKIVRIEDFKAWIRKQPDDRPVNMGQCNNWSGACGCAMVQYGREHDLFGGNDIGGCGYDCWSYGTGDESLCHEFENNMTIKNLFDPDKGWRNHTTFGQLKDALI